MARTIDEIRMIHPTAFKHIGDPTQPQAIDIAPGSLRGAEPRVVLRDRLLSAFRRDKAISTVLGHGQGDPAIHIEIPQN